MRRKLLLVLLLIVITPTLMGLMLDLPLYSIEEQASYCLSIDGTDSTVPSDTLKGCSEVFTRMSTKFSEAIAKRTTQPPDPNNFQ